MLHIRYIMRIALCIFLEYAESNMPRMPKPSISAQQPKLGLISFQDIQWAPRREFGKMLIIMVICLPFNRIEYFIASQTCADEFAVEWIIAVRICGAQVERLQIDSYIEHVYCECAFGPKDHT